MISPETVRLIKLGTGVAETNQLIEKALSIFDCPLDTSSGLEPPQPLRFWNPADGVANLKMILSSGQAGAGRTALDVARKYDLPHGGWCPRKRKAEDGPIDGRYHLIETPSPDYVQCTDWNVRDSDGTVILTIAKKLTGGLLRVPVFAETYGRPWMHFPLCEVERNCWMLERFIFQHRITVLNVTGSRASQEPDIGNCVQSWLEDIFFWKP